MASLLQDNENMYQRIFAELKALGVKVPKVKKFKTNILKQDVSLSEKESKLFGVSLTDQEWVQHEEHTLPKFILMATTYLQKFTDKEGLFRKAGNVARQRKLRTKIEKGESFEDSDPNDVACLLKQWLRELPEPLIPYYLQSLFIRCQNLDTEKNCTSACLLACLLLPPDHLNPLRHLLHFLADVASNSNKSRMSTYNLALVMAPNIFATNESIEKVSSYMNNLVYQHTAVMKILIENSDKIGEVPQTVSIRQSLQRPELTASLDLSPSANKSKRRLRNDIISGFKKLVGQNEAPVVEKTPNREENLLKAPLPRSAFKRKADPDLESMSPTKKQALSVNDLDDSSLGVTQNFKAIFPATDKNSNGHTRRKSFATLILRRKNKNRKNKNLQEGKLSIFDDKKSTREQKDSQEKLEKCQKLEEMNNSNVFANSVSSANERNTSSDHLTCDFKILSIEDDSQLKLDRALTTSRSSQSTEDTSACHQTAVKQNVATSSQRIIRQEVLNVKQPAKSVTSIPTTEIKKVRSKGSIKTCSHAQNSACNTKCDKNKSATGERRIPEQKSNQKSVSRMQSGSVKMNQKLKLSKKESFDVLKSSSPVGLKTRDYASKSTRSDRSSPAETSTPQSLDVSLSLMLQNFCLSPPNDPKEIRLSIGITSDNHNPELKVNISKRESSPNQSSSSENPHKSSGTRTRRKYRNRLSSNSDSHIPRLRKPYVNRPKSFSGKQLGCKATIQKASGHSELSPPCSTKIPVMCVKSVPLSTPKRDESTSDSCFKTPNSSFFSSDSVFYMNDSHYLSAIGTPDEACYKRESISRFLKENTGHVKEKISLYDSRLQRQSSSCSSVTKSEKGKLLRASSEKYHPRYRCKTNLCISNSYDSTKRSEYLQSKSFNYTRCTPPKFVLTNLDTPSPSKETKENENF